VAFGKALGLKNTFASGLLQTKKYGACDFFKHSFVRIVVYYIALQRAVALHILIGYNYSRNSIQQ